MAVSGPPKPASEDAAEPFEPAPAPPVPRLAEQIDLGQEEVYERISDEEYADSVRESVAEMDERDAERATDYGRIVGNRNDDFEADEDFEEEDDEPWQVTNL